MNERDLFIAALQKDDPHERAALLERACADQPALRQRVERLLGAYDGADSFLTSPVRPGPATVDEPAAEAVGTVVGRYKLLQQIGEGGMGTVYMAEQQQPVRRTVALKIIKPGMDSAQVIARFEAERQALALMDHPNIAKVLDAGMTAESEPRQLGSGSNGPLPNGRGSGGRGSDGRGSVGRPYFVMELVKGIPITRFCDEHQLTPRERLELFLPVCHAVQHAHQKGIIHRDLKPSNVLVAEYDDKPVPKVIDFGVAKATSQRLTERTMFTEFGSLVGTLEYMSPEQAKLNALDIDTRSDVYALGVLLYELLTGGTPLERARVQEAALDELLRLIREEEPPKPSTRLSQSGAALATISARRRTEPGKLGKVVRGDLDWIVMKALEKDRARRYETASALAADVRRFLGEEPIEARPPSAWYRFRKLARRYKVALTTAGLVAAALVLGTAVSVWQAVRAGAERDRANSETASAQATLRFLLADVLEHAGPEREANRDLKVRTLLDNATERLDGNTELPPLTEAAIRQTVGRIYRSLGEYQTSEAQLTRAYNLQRQHAGDDAPGTLDAAYHLAFLYWIQNDFTKASPLYRRVLDGRRRLYGEGHRDTLEAVNGLAYCFNSQGESDRAVKLYVPAIEAGLRAYGDRDPITLDLMFNLGTVYSTLGRLEEAEPLMARALKAQKALLKDKHPHILSERTRLAQVLLRLNRLPEAEREAKQAFEDRREVHGPTDPHTLTSQATLVAVYLAQGRRGDADPLMRDLRAKAQRRQERMPSFAIGMIADVGDALRRGRDFVEAESFFRLTLDLAAKQSLDSGWRSSWVSALGACLLGQNKYAEAEPLLREGYEGLRPHEEGIPTGFARIRPTQALAWLVQLYEEWDKPAEAAKWRQQLEAAQAH